MEKYLFITPSLACGGAERAVANLSSELAAQGEDVTVLHYFTMPNEYPLDSRVKRINLSGGTEEVYNTLGYVQKIRMLRKLLRQQAPDYIFPFLPQVTIHAAIAGFDMRKRIIHTVRNNPALTPENPVKRFLCNQIICHSWKTLAQNESQRSFYPRRCQNKIYVLFNPVAQEMLEAGKISHEGGPRLIGVGRLNSQKNFPMLIRAMVPLLREHPEASLEIYGEGELRDSLREQIQTLGLSDSVRLMGRSSNMKAVYESADLFVLSSDFEGMPNTLIEAMAVGLPCISTDCETGPRDLITDGEDGILVPVGGEEALTEAVMQLLGDPERRERMGKRAKEKIRSLCAAEAIVRRLTEICHI